jgi:integrase
MMTSAKCRSWNGAGRVRLMISRTKNPQSCLQHSRGGVYRRMRRVPETGQHSAEVERDRGSAQGAGLGSPTHAAIVRNTLKDIRRTLGTAPAQKAPALTDDIRAIVAATDAGLIGARDRAPILLGFAGAFRRSELVRLDSEYCAFSKDGLTVTLRRSKVDQEGQGRRVALGENHKTLYLFRRRFSRGTLTTVWHLLMSHWASMRELKELFRQGQHLFPDRVDNFVGRVMELLILQRFDEAWQMLAEAQASKPDGIAFHETLYGVAFVTADSGAVAREQQWFAARPDVEYEGHSLASDTEAYVGRVGKARD